MSLDDRVPTMGVFASGRLVVNPAFAEKLKEDELIFVLAHELLHLALRTHDRARGSQHLEFNYAHDYIINDILRVELGVEHVPAGGLEMPGASKRSAEEIVLEMRRNADDHAVEDRGVRRRGDDRRPRVRPAQGEGRRAISGRSRHSRRRARRAAREGDVPGRSRGAGGGRRRDQGAWPLRGSRWRGPSARSRASEATTRARHRRSSRRCAASIAHRGRSSLQRWMESVAPGERTFVRASRRGADRSDLVLPGRRREGWMLNVIVDTSGSMADEIPRALGAIADFCDAVAVDQIRLLQCDVTVTSDELLSPSELAQYTVTGYGGSDLTPAMELLAADPQVRAAAIITDGDMQFPADPMPYAVLWVLPPGRSAAFHPGYGRIVVMEEQHRMKVIQELVAHFERQNKLSPDEIRALLDQGFLASDAPARIQDLCDTPGTTYYFRVTGATEGVDLGHGRLHGRLSCWRRRPCTPAPSRLARRRSSASR